MSFIRVHPMMRIGDRRPDHDHSRLGTVAMVSYGEDAFTMVPVGSIVRDGVLWKNAVMNLQTKEGLVTVRGLPQIAKALRRMAPKADIRITLPIHDGYVATFDDEGAVAARLMRVEGGLQVRVMNPHRSLEIEGDGGSEHFASSLHVMYDEMRKAAR
jgi:hypothetical protein